MIGCSIIVPTTRVLPAVPRREWLPSSQAMAKDQFGNEDRTRFRIRARDAAGRIVWTGWFADRDDADAFLLAAVCGALGIESPLWRMPTPQWHPDLGEDLQYDFATLTFLTTTGANTWTVASDWNSVNNTCDTIGAGGAGGGCNSGRSSGGAGGGFSQTPNVSLTPGASVNYTVGAGGTGVNGAAGNAGGSTFFNGTTLAGSSVGANGGGGGITAGTAVAGASTTGAVGTTKYAGGGSSAVTASAGSGGGGAGGPNGAGNTGSAANSDGGSGDAGSGGAGGSGDGVAGSAGTEYDASHGSGGGGSGRTSVSATAGGAGGAYGAGGGGTRNTGTATGGAGSQGLITLTYTPAAKYPISFPMLGM